MELLPEIPDWLANPNGWFLFLLGLIITPIFVQNWLSRLNEWISLRTGGPARQARNLKKQMLENAVAVADPQYLIASVGALLGLVIVSASTFVACVVVYMSIPAGQWLPQLFFGGFGIIAARLMYKSASILSGYVRFQVGVQERFDRLRTLMEKAGEAGPTIRAAILEIEAARRYRPSAWLEPLPNVLAKPPPQPDPQPTPTTTDPDTVSKPKPSSRRRRKRS